MSDSDTDKLLDIFNDDNNDNAADKIDDIPLPSARKKAANNKKKEKKQTPKVDLDKLLASAGDFTIGSDELSPVPSVATKKSETNANFERKKPESLEQIEKNLIGYINDSINKVKTQFIDELKYSISKTSEEDSAISAFILGIPHEVEEVIAEEIKSYHRHQTQSVTSIDNNVEAHLSLVRKVLQVQDRNMQLLPISPEKIAELDRSVIQAIDQIDTNIKIPLETLKFERSDATRQTQAFPTNTSVQTSSSKAKLLETEATLHQLDVALDLLESRKTRILESQSAWREIQIQSGDENQPNDLIEVQQLAQRVNAGLSQSKDNSEAPKINKLSSSIAQEIDSIIQSNTQINEEMSKLSKKINKRRARKEEKVYQFREPQESSSESGLINEIKERLRIINKDHDRMLK